MCYTSYIYMCNGAGGLVEDNNLENFPDDSDHSDDCDPIMEMYRHAGLMMAIDRSPNIARATVAVASLDSLSIQKKKTPFKICRSETDQPDSGNLKHFPPAVKSTDDLKVRQKDKTKV